MLRKRITFCTEHFLISFWTFTASESISFKLPIKLNVYKLLNSLRFLILNLCSLLNNLFRITCKISQWFNSCWCLAIWFRTKILLMSISTNKKVIGWILLNLHMIFHKKKQDAVLNFFKSSPGKGLWIVKKYIVNYFRL